MSLTLSSEKDVLARKKYLVTQKLQIDSAPSMTNIVPQLPQTNIFKIVNKENKSYKEYNSGPVYHGNEVIQRSIVGKADMFNRMKSLSQTSIRFLPPGTQNVVSKFAARLSQKRISMVNIKNTSTTPKSVIKEENETKTTKRTAKDYDILTKNEVIKQARLIAQRIIDNESKELAELRTKPRKERLELTKEQRILQRFSEQQRIWEEQQTKLQSHTFRNQNETIFASADSYRKKVEAHQINEALKLQEGQITTNQWYMSLRQTPMKKLKNVIVSEESFKQQQKDLVFQDYQNYNGLVVDQTMKPLELIRHTSFYSKMNASRSRLNSTTSVFSPTNHLPFYKIAAVDDTADLQIEGSNVLKLEMAILNEADKFRLYRQPIEEQVN